MRAQNAAILYPPRSRPLALAAIALAAGLVVGFNASAPALVWSAASLVAGLLIAAAWRATTANDSHAAAAALVAIGLAGSLIGYSEARLSGSDCRRAWSAGARVELTATALDFLPDGVRSSVRLRPVRRQDCRWRGPLKAWLEGPIDPGAVYSLVGFWQPSQVPSSRPRPPQRWGWLAVRDLETVSTAARPHPFLRARAHLASSLWRVYPEAWAPLALALVLGERETIDPDVQARIARAGLAHLLAISGLHVGLLAAMFFAGVRLLGGSERRAVLGSSLFASVYVLLIGMPPSAVRAALMIMLWALARLAGRPSSAFDSIGLAAIAILLVRPWSVFEAGFQLSFAGATAVSYVGSELRRWAWMADREPWLRRASAGVVASVAVVLLTAPVTAAHFGRVAPAAVLGNLVAIPLLAFTMPALLTSALLAGSPELAAWPASAATVTLAALNAVAAQIGELPAATLAVRSPGTPGALAYLVVLILAARLPYGAWERRRFVRILGLVAAVALIWAPALGRLVPERVTVHVLDVGQGDAIAVRTPNGHWLLIDAGPRGGGFDAGRSRVLPALRQRGVRRLEALIASHPDIDHVGGAPAVIEDIDVGAVIGAGVVTGQLGQMDLFSTLMGSETRWLRASAGSRFSIDGVELVFLHPSPAIELDGDNVNDLSLIFRLEFGRFHMLFTGDASGGVEDSLARADPSALSSQILKVSHHGSRTSTSTGFLRTVSPEVAVVSVGLRNRYGHPSLLVLKRLHDAGVEVRRTDIEGTLTIEADRDGNWSVGSAAQGY